MKCGSYVVFSWLGCCVLGAIGITAEAQSGPLETTGYLQEVLSGPYSEVDHVEIGYAALENASGELLLGGTAFTAPNGAPFSSAALIARLDSEGALLDWSEYGAALAERPTTVQLMLNAQNDGIIAGGTMAGAGYLLRLNTAGERLWSATLGNAGIERVAAIDVLSDGGFFVFGESGYRTGDADSGKYTIVKIDDGGNLSEPARYGALQQEEIVAVVRVVRDAFHVYSYAYGDDIPPELWVRGFDADGVFLWEKSLGNSPDYPVAGVHLTRDRNPVLVRPKLLNGVFDGACRLEYVDQEGNHYRTRDLIVDIYGTDLVGAVQFTDNRFGIVAYDKEAVHVAVCDYRLGYFSRQMIPVDQSLAADLGAAGPVVARPEIHGTALRDNGNLVLVGALISEPEVPSDESGPAVDLYRLEIKEDALYLDFSELIGVAGMALLENFDTGDISGDGTLRYYEAVIVHPSLTLEMFNAMDLDDSNTLSYEEVEQAAYNYYKYGPGGIAFCGTGPQRIGGDWALAFVMLAFLLYWGRRMEIRRRHVL